VTISKIAQSETPVVSVIIPSLDGDRGGNVRLLLDDLNQQTFQDLEIIIVSGIRPQGKAINQAAAEAGGEFLLVIDDDIRPGSPDVIQNLVTVLREHPDVGLAGASIVPPTDGSWLQRRLAHEMPRFSMPLVKRITDSDMPCHGCCAISAKLFHEIGREIEVAPRGLDPDLRRRVREHGRRIVLAPNSVAYHPLPTTFGAVMKMFYRNGRSSAFLQRHYPHLVAETPEAVYCRSGTENTSLRMRALRFPLRWLGRVLRGHIIRAIGELAYATGYAIEFTRRAG